jgi:Domain of unknown function (DUF4384)/Caspase domain
MNRSHIRTLICLALLLGVWLTGPMAPKLLAVDETPAPAPAVNPQPVPTPDNPTPEPATPAPQPTPAPTTPKPATPAPTPDKPEPAPAPKPETPAPKPEPSDPEQIIQQQPSFMVRVSVNRANHIYREGDALSVNVICERDAYAYVLYKQADGKVFQIFPNSIQQDNRIKAKKNVSIPALDDQFRWRISAPFGKEMIKVIASTEPVKNLDDPALHAKRFNAISKSLVKDVAAKLEQTKPVEWAEDQVEINTLGRDEKLPANTPRRLGVFFGVSQYKYNDLVKESTEGKWGPNLPTPAQNAAAISQLFKQFGRLDEVQLFVNEQATRAQMQQSITEWLPKVSKPGDTVFIYFSGHGGVIPPYKETDEHVKGSYLLPHDYVSVGAAVMLQKYQKEHRISAEQQALLDTWLDWIGDAKESDQQQEAMIRNSCVTDDMFGHWLQRLAGRQVVVILDACHSAGFADEGKDFGPAGGTNLPGNIAATIPRASGNFGYLSSQLNRLKDIGHNDTALLTACGSKETTLAVKLPKIKLPALYQNKELIEALAPERMSVFSYCVAEQMLASQGPTKIESTYESCRAAMKQYIDQLNEKIINDNNHLPADQKPEELITIYQPRLFNYCSEPVLMKP